MTKPTLTRRAFGGLAAASALTPVLAGLARAQDRFRSRWSCTATLATRAFSTARRRVCSARRRTAVDLTIIEAGSDRGRWQPALADAVDQGFNVVIAGTWEMTGFMVELAPEYPDTSSSPLTTRPTLRRRRSPT